MKLTKIQISRIVILLVIILGLSSCVAKKKYIEMEGYKNRAENRVIELTKDVANLKEEFNEYNNQFYYNNAQKDAYIDSLNQIITSLNSDLTSTTEKNEDKVSSFQIEKRRLNQLLADKDKEINRLQQTNKGLSARVDNLELKIADLQIDLKNAESSANNFERQISSKENEIEKLNTKLVKQKAELSSLKQQIEDKEEQIESLNNQVKLLKSQFGKTN